MSHSLADDDRRRAVVHQVVRPTLLYVEPLHSILAVVPCIHKRLSDLLPRSPALLQYFHSLSVFQLYFSLANPHDRLSCGHLFALLLISDKTVSRWTERKARCL